MKKILFVIALFTCTAAISQTATLKSQYDLTVDTVTNTATKYLTVGGTAAISKAGKYTSVQLEFNAAEISGTTAGTAQPQASIDNVTFYDIGSAFTLTDVATQATAWTFTTWPHVYLRIKVTGSGTMSDKIYGKVLFKQ